MIDNIDSLTPGLNRRPARVERLQKRRGTIITLAVLLMIIMIVGLMAPSLLFIALASFVMFILVVPLLHTAEIDWFAPWSFVLYSGFVGILLRAIYITFDIPSASIINTVFLLGQSKEFLVWPMVLVAAGIGCLTLGFIAGPAMPRKWNYKICQSDWWNERRFWIALSVLLLISWIGFYYFVQNTVEDLSVDKLSAQRGVAADLNDYRAYGYLRWMASMSDLVFSLCVVRVISTRKFRTWAIIFGAAAFLTSMLYGIFSSSRGGVAVLFLNALAITYYLRGRKVKIVKVFAAILVMLFFVKVLTIWRVTGQFDEGIRQGSNVTEIFDPVILSVTLIDVSKTAHIVSAIPGNLDYQWGWTFSTIILAWIPRDVWREKPVTNADTIVGQAVFGATSYGAGAVPPGLIAESYLNFSVPGVIIICFLCGFFLKFITTNFENYATNRNVVLLYVTSLMTIGLWFLGSSLTSVIIGSLFVFIPLSIVLTFMTTSSEQSALELPNGVAAAI
jgi:oligosaccharide repeat unit polymerase